MTEAEQRIDDAVNRMLKAAGNLTLNHYMPTTQTGLRETMRGIMSESYIAGSNDCLEVTRPKAAKGKQGRRGRKR